MQSLLIAMGAAKDNEIVTSILTLSEMMDALISAYNLLVFFIIHQSADYFFGINCIKKWLKIVQTYPSNFPEPFVGTSNAFCTTNTHRKLKIFSLQ